MTTAQGFFLFLPDFSQEDQFFVFEISPLFGHVIRCNVGQIVWLKTVILRGVVAPAGLSFLCFLPFALLIQYLCILIEHLIGRIFAGIFIIISTFVGAHSNMSKYLITCWPYKIMLEFKHVTLYIIVSLLLLIAFFSIGTKLIHLRVRRITCD